MQKFCLLGIYLILLITSGSRREQYKIEPKEGATTILVLHKRKEMPRKVK